MDRGRERETSMCERYIDWLTPTCALTRPRMDALDCDLSVLGLML